jgi:anti-sigma B factor antagonist
MKIQIEDNGVTAKVVLAGKLDIVGAEVVALPLATLSGGKQSLTIDISGVTFIASIGIRHLISASCALARRGGSLTLLDPSEVVAEMLTTSGATELMTVGRSAG